MTLLSFVTQQHFSIVHPSYGRLMYVTGLIFKNFSTVDWTLDVLFFLHRDPFRPYPRKIRFRGRTRFETVTSFEPGRSLLFLPVPPTFRQSSPPSDSTLIVPPEGSDTSRRIRFSFSNENYDSRNSLVITRNLSSLRTGSNMKFHVEDVLLLRIAPFFSPSRRSDYHRIGSILLTANFTLLRCRYTLPVTCPVYVTYVPYLFSPYFLYSCLH